MRVGSGLWVADMGMPPPSEQQESALAVQVGGGHYKTLAIQPVEFCMSNDYDFAAASIVKYVTRHRSKNGKQDIEKALHFARIRGELLHRYGGYSFLVTCAHGLVRLFRHASVRRPPRVVEYIRQNNLGFHESHILLLLDTWVALGNHPKTATLVIESIERLLVEYDYFSVHSTNR